MPTARRRSRGRLTLVAVVVLVAAAGLLALAGWRITLRFVGPEAAPAARSPRASVYLRLLPIGRYGLTIPDEAAPAARPPALPTPRSFSGLHMTFSRDWPQGSYEIGAHPSGSGSAAKGQTNNVRLVCDACSAVSSAFHRSPGSSAGEKLLIDAASFSVIKMMGNGRMTIVEWDPY